MTYGLGEEGPGAGTSREGLNGCSLLIDTMAIGWGEVAVGRRKACLGMGGGIKRTRASGASKRPQCQPLLLLLMGELWTRWGTGAGTVH